jgi:hypothetical protein
VNQKRVIGGQRKVKGQGEETQRRSAHSRAQCVEPGYRRAAPEVSWRMGRPTTESVGTDDTSSLPHHGGLK